jgi:ketosteroid isomerase-like protein
MENKELVSAFLQHFSDGEIEQAFALVHDDVS